MTLKFPAYQALMEAGPFLKQRNDQLLLILAKALNIIMNTVLLFKLLRQSIISRFVNRSLPIFHLFSASF